MQQLDYGIFTYVEYQLKNFDGNFCKVCNREINNYKRIHMFEDEHIKKIFDDKTIEKLKKKRVGFNLVLNILRKYKEGEIININDLSIKEKNKDLYDNSYTIKDENLFCIKCKYHVTTANRINHLQSIFHRNAK